MKKIVCPYCDQPIKGHYCRGCRRYVKNPVVTETDYYLNERHPAGAHDCEYHDDQRDHDHRLTPSEVEAKKQEIRERMTAKRREKSVSSPSYESQIPRQTAKRYEMTIDTGKNKKKGGRGKLIFLLYLMLLFGSYAYGCAADMIENTVYGISTTVLQIEPEEK